MSFSLFMICLYLSSIICVFTRRSPISSAIIYFSFNFPTSFFLLSLAQINVHSSTQVSTSSTYFFFEPLPLSISSMHVTLFKRSRSSNTHSVTRKKLPNVYKSCPKLISLEKIKILTPLRKQPKNVGDLGKLIDANGFENLPKVQKIG